MATVALLVQQSVELQNQYVNYSGYFDLDQALGVQLDIVGKWIGAVRDLQVPLTDVWFTWGSPTLGWGLAPWLGPQDQAFGMVRLQDEFYRTLLRAIAAANQWDGTLPDLYKFWSIVFELEKFLIIVRDNQDMTITVDILATTIDVVRRALIEDGKIVAKPAGVRITGYNLVEAPLFGWGISNGLVEGWGRGLWST